MFKQPTAIATCNTVTGGATISDEDLQERVARMVYGVGAKDVEAVEGIIEEERRAAEAKEAQDAIPAQCTRLFTRREEVEACRRLRMLSTRMRTDEQMQLEVKAYLERERAAIAVADKEKQRKAAAERARNAELGKGAIGFTLDRWERSEHVSVMTITFTLQNNTAGPQKDFVIGCNTYANSGTELTTKRQTLYELLQPKGRRTFQLNMGLVHSQSTRTSCRLIASNQ